MGENSEREEISRECWVEYLKNPTKEFQKRVIDTYDYIPRTIAYQFARKKPHLLDVEDLIQAGRMGLVQAIGRYNPEQSAKFNTFATFRVRGAILDQINKVDWTPRPVRERIKKVIRVIEMLNGQANDDSSNDAKLIAEHIDDMTIEEVEKVLLQLKKTYITHIDKDVMSALEFNNPDQIVRDNNQRLRTVMNMVLDFKERNVIDMKFFGGYKDYEILAKMKITQHQLNQIEKRALEKLAHNLTDEDFN
jgi:RNA polymerase sigma factor for flagellar operon FliA